MARCSEHDIKTSLDEDYGKNCQYWGQVLERIVKVILFLGERGLAIRGHNETIGSPRWIPRSG
jgi:hypothetical protein